MVGVVCRESACEKGRPAWDWAGESAMQALAGPAVAWDSHAADRRQPSVPVRLPPHCAVRAFAPIAVTSAVCVAKTLRWEAPCAIRRMPSAVASCVFPAVRLAASVVRVRSALRAAAATTRFALRRVWSAALATECATTDAAQTAVPWGRSAAPSPATIGCSAGMGRVPPAVGRVKSAVRSEARAAAARRAPSAVFPGLAGCARAAEDWVMTAARTGHAKRVVASAASALPSPDPARQPRWMPGLKPMLEPMSATHRLFHFPQAQAPSGVLKGMDSTRVGTATRRHCTVERRTARPNSGMAFPRSRAPTMPPTPRPLL